MGLRDRAMLETLYSTGMRRSELIALQLYDLDAERGTVLVRQGKGKGNVEYWVAQIQPGRMLYEIEGVSEELAREAFKLAAAKLPVDTAFVKRTVL